MNKTSVRKDRAAGILVDIVPGLSQNIQDIQEESLSAGTSDVEEFLKPEIQTVS